MIHQEEILASLIISEIIGLAIRIRWNDSKFIIRRRRQKYIQILLIRRVIDLINLLFFNDSLQGNATIETVINTYLLNLCLLVLVIIHRPWKCDEIFSLWLEVSNIFFFVLIFYPVADTPTWNWVAMGVVRNWKVFFVCTFWIGDLDFYPSIFIGGCGKFFIEDHIFNIRLYWYFQDDVDVLLHLDCYLLIIIVKDRLHILSIAISSEDARYFPLNSV